MFFILTSPAVELGFLQSLTLFQCPGQLWISFFSLLLCLLFLTAPNKAIVWFTEENRGYGKIFLIVIFRAQLLSFPSFPFILCLAASYIFILFSSCCFQRMPVAIHQQNCGHGWGFTCSKPTYAALHDPPPASFHPCTISSFVPQGTDSG